MKFKIDRDAFSYSLLKGMNVVGTHITLPILSNILIEAKKDHIYLATNNLDLGISSCIQAVVEEEGAITLPVRKLATIIRELPHKDVYVKTLKDNKAQIKSGSSFFRMMGMSQEEFPRLPCFDDKKNHFVLQQSELLRMLRSVSYAQSASESRYILNGVYFKFGSKKLTLVATDGRRLALISSDLDGENDEKEKRCIIPSKTVKELERLLGKGKALDISFNERQVAFNIQIDSDENETLKKEIYLVSRIIEGTYPDYRQVLPKKTELRIKVERELMLECLNRATLMTSDKDNAVTLYLRKNVLEILASSSEYGEAHESMAVQYEGDEVQLCFNPWFMMAPLRVLSNDEVFFEFSSDSMSPGSFKTNESFCCVVMPVRHKASTTL